MRITVATRTSYSYDGDGKRLTKTVGASPPITYTYDVNGALPNVLSDGTLKYVYGLGLAYTVDVSNTVQVVHTDGLGSVRALSDNTGALIETFQTAEFGNPAMIQGTSSEAFRYTGQQNDPETSFYYLRARYYWPTLGRFVSRDRLFGSVSSPLTLNRFSYVQNNPMNIWDPSGFAFAVPQDPTQGSTATPSVVLQDSYDRALS